MNAVAILECASLSRSYRKRAVLSVRDLAFSSGVTSLLGPNGAGKSTLIRALATAERRPQDRVRFGGETLHRSNLREFRRSLGWLPQSFEPPKSADLLSFVEYIAWLRDVGRRSRRNRALEALETVGLVDRAHDAIGTLSGGMIRRLGIAQAIVNRPAVVLLDEPTVSLDPEQRSDFCAIVRSAVAPEATVIASTHLLEDVDALGGSVVALARGHVAFSGSMAEFAAAENPTLDQLRSGYESHVGTESDQ